MRRLLSATALALIPSLLSAQSLSEQTRAQDAGAPTRIIAVNPFLPLFGLFQGEFERRLQSNLSVALGASYTEWDNDKYGNVDAKLRLYPQERGLEGLGLAASLGLGFVNRRAYDECESLNPSCSRVPAKNVVAPAFAIESQYQWLLGSSRKTAVAAGFGVKRYFASEQDLGGDSRVRPTGRLTIGYAF